ncbi:alpha/beta hydrolase [Chachezhania antarctica]|uniref:alpha/beta hydrolase n=1 Tax=Chachezhania antarctica TaxID=2340860 RepID=UPI000EAF9BD4|nr:alpha/beta hydrolase [Chachezhania antarctica]
MPFLRINAEGDAPVWHGTGALLGSRFDRVSDAPGPVVVMIHGYKYRPGDRYHCPHRGILSPFSDHTARGAPSWPRQLGFGTGRADEGLGIGFGWNARGALWTAQARATEAGRALARVLERLHRQCPDRPVHIVAHSMGTGVALEALHHLPPGAVSRILSLTGACYQSRVEAALATQAGARAEFINVTSRENDTFDFLYERLIAPPRPGDRAIGLGLAHDNVLTLQLDSAQTLTHLDRLGCPVGPSQRRVCHWSAYSRPGVLRFYDRLIRRPEIFTFDRLRRGLPEQPDPRWSRLVAMPALPRPLPPVAKAS